MWSFFLIPYSLLYGVCYILAYACGDWMPWGEKDVEIGRMRSGDVEERKIK